MVTGYAEAPVSVIPRSEATWESPGTIHRNEPQYHTWYRKIATALRPRNDTAVDSWAETAKWLGGCCIAQRIYNLHDRPVDDHTLRPAIYAKWLGGSFPPSHKRLGYIILSIYSLFSICSLRRPIYPVGFDMCLTALDMIFAQNLRAKPYIEAHRAISKRSYIDRRRRISL